MSTTGHDPPDGPDQICPCVACKQQAAASKAFEESMARVHFAPRPLAPPISGARPIVDIQFAEVEPAPPPTGRTGPGLAKCGDAQIESRRIASRAFAEIAEILDRLDGPSRARVMVSLSILYEGNE